jgi:hypothetical protein
VKIFFSNPPPYGHGAGRTFVSYIVESENTQIRRQGILFAKDDEEIRICVTFMNK